MSSTTCGELAARLSALYDLAASLAAAHAAGADAGWAFGRDWASSRMAEVRHEIIDVEKAMHAAKCPFPTLTVGPGTTPISVDPPSMPLPIDPKYPDEANQVPSGDSPWPDPGKGGRNKPKL